LANVPGYFSTVFGRSPFRDLQNHAGLCILAAEKLLVLFPATFADDWTAVEATYDHLTRIENEADELKRKIRTSLPNGFFLPVARADLLDLLGRQDELANSSRDVAGMVLGRKLKFPNSLESRVLALVTGSVDTCRKSRQIIDRLDELIDTAFKGPQARIVVSMIEEVEALEQLTDQLVVEIRAELFKMEDNLPPIQAMFLYKALDLLAGLADGAEQVAHRVQLMLAR